MVAVVSEMRGGGGGCGTVEVVVLVMLVVVLRRVVVVFDVVCWLWWSLWELQRWLERWWWWRRDAQTDSRCSHAHELGDVATAVRMVDHRQRAIHLLDLLLGRAAIQAKHYTAGDGWHQWHM